MADVLMRLAATCCLFTGVLAAVSSGAQVAPVGGNVDIMIVTRFSRTGSCVLSAAGTCSGAWDGAAYPAGASIRYVGDPTAVNAGGSLPITCNYTAAASASGFSAKCWVDQTVVVSLGALPLSISPTAPAPAGTVVNATSATVSQ